MDTRKLIGLKIKEIRKAKNITQEKLAEEIGMDVGYISKLEVGLSAPSIETFEKLACVLDVDIADFFEFTNLRNLDLKSEINKIFDKLSKESQIALYQITKNLK